MQATQAIAKFAKVDCAYDQSVDWLTGLIEVGGMEGTGQGRSAGLWRSAVGWGTTALAIAGVLWLQQAKLNQSALNADDVDQVVEQKALRLSMLRQLPSFGFENLLADWVFLDFLEYFGDDEARDQSGYGLSPQYFELITQRNPRFVQVYPFLSSSVSYQLGQPKLALEMMRRGAKSLSPAMDAQAFQIWRFMSLDQLLLLGDTKGAIQSLETAADWVEGTPYAAYQDRFRQTAEFLRQDPDSKVIRVSAWAEVYQRAAAVGDQKTQERAKKEILALGGKILEKEGRLFIQAPPRSTPQKPKSQATE